MKILLITEQRDGKWNNVSFETLAAAQQIAQQTKGSISGVVIGKGVAALADELAGYQIDEVILIEHDLLAEYTPDGYSHRAAPGDRKREAGSRTAAAHLPSARFRAEARRVHAKRNDRRLHRVSLRKREADFRAPDVSGEDGGGCGVHRRAAVDRVIPSRRFSGETWRRNAASGKAEVKAAGVDLKPEQIRTKPLELFREAKQAVDLTQAPILVSVGRGIKAPENIPMAEKLAKLLGGEISASRPICDEGWLPMDRQIGSSGQTVVPKLYLALGISGAIQHVVGMKGSRTIVAINKDQNAPIFEIADYGIVGDLFEIVPALIEELEKAPTS